MALRDFNSLVEELGNKSVNICMRKTFQWGSNKECFGWRASLPAWLERRHEEIMLELRLARDGEVKM